MYETMNSTILKMSLLAYNDDSFCKTEWHFPSYLEGHFLGIRRGVELHLEEVTFLPRDA